MNQNQRNHKAMFNAVFNVFEEYVTTLETNPMLDQVRQDFIAQLTELSEVQMIQEGHATGSGQLKQQEETKMIQATVRVAAAIYVYALDNNKPDLQAKTNFTPSHLQRMGAEKLKTTCLNIHELATQQNGNLTDYGITTDDIALLKKEIDDYSAVIVTPRSAVVTRSQATARIAELVTELNQLLKNKADKLMLLFQQTDPKLYQTYKAARIIVDFRKAKRKEVSEVEEEVED